MAGGNEVPVEPRRGRWQGPVLLIISTTLAFLFAEFAVRILPLSDRLGWSLVPPVPERAAAAAGSHGNGKTRILALGDSFTLWRDTTGDSFVRVAERALPRVEMVNLAEAGTGLDHYFSNLLRFGEALHPDGVVIGLYLGNDLVPCTPPLDSEEARIRAMNPPLPAPEGLVKRLAKHSILLNTSFRLAKLYFKPLRSGFFDQMLDQLKDRTGKDDAFVAGRLAAVDPRLVDAARADAINGWDLAFAMFDPRYYGDLAAAEPGTPKGEDVEGGLKGLGVLIDEVRRQHAKVAVVLLPPPVWVSGRYENYFRRLGYTELGPTTGPVPLIEKTRAFLAGKGVPALDVLESLRAAREPVYLENDIHLNRRGQQIVGEELARWLIDQGIVSRS